MKKISAEHVAMILSLLVAAGAMVFTGFQTKLLRKSVGEQTTQTRLSRTAVQAQTWQMLCQPDMELSKVFIEHSEFRPYFYENKPFTKDDPNYHAVASIAEMYLDFIETFSDDYVADLPDMEPNGVNRVLWDKYFADMFASSPALQNIARAEQKWYSTDFDKYMPTPNAETKKTSNKTNGE